MLLALMKCVDFFYLENTRTQILDKIIMKFIGKLFSWNEIQSSHRLMILIVFVLGALNFFWGEKVPAGGGLGWDGVAYADMVRNINLMIKDGHLGSYHAQRVLPSVIVRSMLLAFETPMSDINIIRGFELYNLALLLAACWVWKRIANNFSLSLSGRWIGFSGIFINYACSKQAFYYPVLTDVSALFIGMLLLLFYVEKKPISLFAVTIIGAFAWPVVSVCGALLLAFLRADIFKAIAVSASTLFPLTLKIVFLVSIIGYVALEQIMPVPEYACNSLPKILSNVSPSSTNPCALHKLLIKIQSLLTALPLLVMMLGALKMLMPPSAFFQTAFASLRGRLPLLMLAMAAVFVPFVIVKIISSSGVYNPNSISVMIKVIIFPAEGKFLLPLVSLAVFWGPVVLLLLFLWREFCSEARKLGLGFVAIITMSFPLAMVGEPRFLTVSWPFFVLGLVLALEPSKIRIHFKCALIILTVVFAQFWMKLNLAPWLTPDYEGLLEFPKQIYFMHYGLWMNWWSYSFQFIALVIGIMWLRKSMIEPDEKHRIF